jgi:hypothetical protein
MNPGSDETQDKKKTVKNFLKPGGKQKRRG